MHPIIAAFCMLLLFTYCSSVGILASYSAPFVPELDRKAEYIVQLLYILSPCVNLIHDLDALHV